MTRVSRWALITLWLTVFGVAGALLAHTVSLAQQIPDFRLAVGGFANPTTTPVPSQTSVSLLSLLATATPLPTTTPAVEPNLTGYHPKTGRYMAAWFPSGLTDGVRQSLTQNADILDEISPFWYTVDRNGRIYGERNDELVQLAHQLNILVIPTIHNISDPGSAAVVIASPQLRARHIQLIVDEVLARGYDGIDIDYEALDPSSREAFTAFIVDLSAALRPQGKLLTVAVHAKTSDYGGLGGYQDWSAIGPHIDRLRIMTYDYHWRGGGPGPVAPLYWVEEVANYARSVVDPAKIEIGVPFYGYDWPTGGGEARALPWSDIEELIAEQKLTVNLMQRNELGRVDESWFRYRSSGGSREVWFTTDGGLDSKIDLVQRLDLAGIAIWRIGYEKPEYWDIIRRRLVRDPVLVQRAINPLLPEH